VARRLGNQQLQRLLLARRLQAKLTVSHPNDVYEQEADRVADQVMRMPEPMARVDAVAPKVVQRVCSSCEEELGRSEDSAGDTPVVDDALENSIGSLAGCGQPLPASVRSFLEPRFGADFSAVRFHTDANAQSLARSVNAQAFTVGRDVVFGAGHYAPETDRGKRLLAHELTHTLQQGHVAAVNVSAREAALQRKPGSEPQEGAGESEMGRVTKIIFDKPAHQATYYLDDHGMEHAVTRTVTEHCTGRSDRVQYGGIATIGFEVLPNARPRPESAVGGYRPATDREG